MRKILIAVLLAIVSTCGIASADALLSTSRITIGAGANYDTFEQKLNLKNEFSAGIYGAYALTAPKADNKVPNIALVGSGVYGFENKLTRWELGVRVALFDGGK